MTQITYKKKPLNGTGKEIYPYAVRRLKDAGRFNIHTGSWDHGPQNDPRFRGGKTKSDHKSGKHNRRLQNRANRAERNNGR